MFSWSIFQKSRGCLSVTAAMSGFAGLNVRAVGYSDAAAQVITRNIDL